MKAKGVLPPHITFPSLYFLMELEHLNATSCPEVNAPHPKAPQAFFFWSFSVPGFFLDALLGLSPSTKGEQWEALCAPQQAPKKGRELRAQGCTLLTGTGLGDGWDTQIPPAGYTFNPPGGREACGSEVLVPVPGWV